MKKNNLMFVAVGIMATAFVMNLAACKAIEVAVSPSTANAETVAVTEEGCDETLSSDVEDDTTDRNSRLDMEWFISHGGTIVSDDDEDTDTPSATPATTPANGGNNRFRLGSSSRGLRDFL